MFGSTTTDNLPTTYRRYDFLRAPPHIQARAPKVPIKITSSTLHDLPVLFFFFFFFFLL
jgi:hypothetical protein